MKPKEQYQPIKLTISLYQQVDVLTASLCTSDIYDSSWRDENEKLFD